MIAKTYTHPKLPSILAAIDGNAQVYLDGTKIATILGYDYPEVAVKQYVGDTYTPLNLIKNEDALYLITGTGKPIDEIAELFLWITDITEDLLRCYFD